MANRLIVIRGNSGSGKTVLANTLRQKIGYKTMLISQDVVRRDILRVHDFLDNPSIDLMYKMAKYGSEINYDVIVEGIFYSKKYEKMIQKISKLFNNNFFYYFDIPFDETLKRHSLKLNHDEFGISDMKKWWHEKDFLNFCSEKIINKDITLEECTSMIMEDIKTK
jgi:adenylylsulfate kinase-like enzyme